MHFSPEAIQELQDSQGFGALRVYDFVEDDLLHDSQQELFDESRVPWRDNHTTYDNDAGRRIIQNYDVYSLRLDQGDQSPLEAMPNTVEISKRVETFVKSLGLILPPLVGWEPNEMSLHRYDDYDVGLSPHHDHTCFTELIAIVSLYGACDIELDEFALKMMKEGDLLLLRAPGLIESDEEVRPMHGVVNLYTQTRVSMSLRVNKDPTKLPKSYTYDNWTAPQSLVEGTTMRG